MLLKKRSMMGLLIRVVEMETTMVVSLPSAEGVVTTLTSSEDGRFKTVAKSWTKAARTVGMAENLFRRREPIFVVKRMTIGGRPVVVGG